MEQNKKILVIGRHADMMKKICGLLEANGYLTTGVLTNEEALKIFELHNFDAVVIGGGVDAESRNLFHSEFMKLNSSIKIIDAHPYTVLNDIKAAFK